MPNDSKPLFSVTAAHSADFVNAPASGARMFRVLFDQSLLGIAIYDATGQLCEANPTCLALFGVSEQKSIQAFNLFAYPGFSSTAQARLAQGEVVRSEVEFDCEMNRQAGFYPGSKKGMIHLDILITPILEDVAPIPRGYLVQLQDITGRKRAELAQRESEDRFRLFMKYNPAYVFFKDEQIRVIDLSDNFATMVGHPAQELVGKTMEELFPPELARNMIADDQRVLHEGKTIEVEEELHGRWYRTTKFPIVREGKPSLLAGFTIDITAQKDAEQKLRSSTLELQNAQRVAHIGSWKWDIHTNRLEWSDEMFRIFGIDRATFQGDLNEVIARAIHPDDRAAVEASNLSVSERGQPIPLEYRIIWPDGSIHTVWAEAGRLERNDAGQPRVLSGIVQDITERKAAIEALRESEERFRKIFEDGPFGMAMVNLEFRFTRINQAFCAMLGYSEEELLGRTFKEITHPDHQLQDIQNIQRLVRGEIPVYRTEKRYCCKNGTTLWAALNVAVIRRADGSFLYFLAMMENITLRKTAEQALAAEKERLQVTLSSIGDGVIATDVAGRIVLMNRIAEELTGWSTVEAISRPLSEIFRIVHEITHRPCENPVDKVLQSGGIVGLANHTVLIRRDGQERIIADSGAPIRTSEGAIIGVVLVFRDITEQQKTELALQNAQRLESIGLLAGGIAHDFNNLLGGIFGYVDMAQEYAHLGDLKQSLHFLDKTLGIFDRAKNLTRQLLTFAKGGSPIRKIQAIGVHLSRSISFALSGSNIAVIYDLPSDLWLVNFDEHQLAQVFDNIAINAQQAMPQGGHLHVAASNLAAAEVPAALTALDYITISIRDSGVGIAPEHLSKIFDPFFTTKRQGSGLGLATAYSIIKRHDGHITVKSELGQGTIFTIYLPATTAQEAALEQAAKNPRHHGQGWILVMDDESFIRDIAQNLLSSMGYQVQLVENGDQAIELVKNAQQRGQFFRFALLDLTIPGGRGGKDTVIHLRQFDPNLKIIASSGYSEDPVMANPAAHGFCGRLIKPYRPEEVGQLLQALSGEESQ